MVGSLMFGRDSKGSDCGLIEYYSGICLGAVKKTTKYLSYDRQYTDQDSNRALPQ
jgi:hypothetical protein